MNPSQLVNRLINLPKPLQDYVVSNISPTTFWRWAAQDANGICKLVDKVAKHAAGEPLSALAQAELRELK